MRSNRTLWRISVTTTLEAEDAVADLLGTVFAASASSHFNVERRTSVVSVFAGQTMVRAQKNREILASGLSQIRSCGLDIGCGKIKIAKVRREDWAESWKRHFKAIEIGDALLIKPSWVKRRLRKNQSVVILDPGLSFGTGQHATTWFCLRELVRQRAIGTPQSFLDIGTGSGILAIAAAKLGYRPVRAFDFDPESVRVARANAHENQVDRKINITLDDVTRLPLRTKIKYDLVCANLISNLLIAERRRIVGQLNQGGTLVLAGVLRSEFSEVQAAFEDLGLQFCRGKIGKEWRSGSFRSRS